MLSRDVVIQDLDARGWANLVDILDRANQHKILGEEREVRPPKQRMLIIKQGDTLLKVWHSEKGSITKGFQWSPGLKPEEIAKREGVHRVTVVEQSAIGKIFGAFQGRMRLTDDYAKQLFMIYEAARAEIGSGIVAHPAIHLPGFGYDSAQGLLKMFVPDHAAVVLYVFQGNAVYGSMILGIADHSLDLLTSHDGLVADGFGFFDWRRDYKSILDAVARLYRKPGIGIFIDVKSAARILKSKTPLTAIAAARKANDLILDPLPAKIKGVLGAGKLFGK